MNERIIKETYIPSVVEYDQYIPRLRRDASVDIIKVSGTSRTSAVAGAIAGVVREHKRAEVQAIGASAINQAVKALALARGYLSNDGLDIICMPEFVDVQIEDKVRTAIKFVVEPR
jgi:stage V sporulation protein S